MKKFLIKTYVYLLLFGLLTFGVCYVIDPYNVFHPLSLRDNGVEPNKNYIKMTYILKNPEKFDAYVFGSSRVSFVNVQKLDGLHAYNMSYSEGTPVEHRDNIRTLVENGVTPRYIFMQIDSASYMEDLDNHRAEALRSPYEYLKAHPLKFAQLYLNPVVAQQSLPIIREHGESETVEREFYAYGCTMEYGHVGEFEVKDHEVLESEGHIPETLAALAETAELCREHDIQLVLFTTPLHYATYAASIERGDYLDFLRGVAAIAPFYNFSGFNDITLNSDYYRDTSHYLPEVGDLVIDSIWHGRTDEALAAQGFGFYTTSENIEQLIALLERGAQAYGSRPAAAGGH